MSEKIKQAVAVALIRGNWICLCKRLNTDCLPGKWQCAGGRRDDDDSTLRVTAIRELKEETGLSITDRRLHLSSIITSDPTCERCNLYEVRLRRDEEPIRMEPKKAGEWIWVHFENALYMDLMPGISEYLKKKLK